MNNSIENRFHKLSHRYLSNCATIQKRVTKKSVHSLRVSAKRIKALLLFTESASDNNLEVRSEFKKLKKIFKKAGVVRNRHIQIELLKQYQQKKILKILQKEDKTEKKELRKAISDSRPDQILPSIGEQIKRADRLDQKELFQHALPFTELLLEDALRKANTKEYHKARIRLKTMHHVLEIFQRQQKAKDIINMIEPLETELGDWHDRLILLELLIKMSAQKEDYSIARLTKKLKHLLSEEEKRLGVNFKLLTPLTQSTVPTSI